LIRYQRFGKPAIISKLKTLLSFGTDRNDYWLLHNYPVIICANHLQTEQFFQWQAAQFSDLFLIQTKFFGWLPIWHP
jgi:hypothetical protein